ncbi:MAG TPA: sensor histidine kinase [Polyangia bacterium]|jgi:signal transduction histidine kinase|nr:sensor histidine kinase [Polyangia bacterium]
MRRELTTEYQLFAENRAFALRDNFEILEDELKRLALLPEMNPADPDLLQEEQILAGAHAHSVLYNTAVLLLDRAGRCVRSVPNGSAFRGESFGDRPWFQAVRGGEAGPLFRITDEPALGQTLKIVQPVVRSGRFVGALVGVIALAEDNLISPTFQENLPRDTDAALIDEDADFGTPGRVIYPPGRPRVMGGSSWAEAIAGASHGTSGTLVGDVNGQKALFAYAPVGGGTRYAVVFCWPWRTLTANIEQQGATLGGILLLGIVVATIAGVLLSLYLSRPLQALADGAIRIARGERVPALNTPRPAGTEEISTLLGAFEQMEQSIQKRDHELREAAALLEQRVHDRTQELVATQAALVEAERFAAMGKTSAAIAHELKNALNGLGMAVDLIAQDPANSARVARLRPQVVGEIARLRDVVDSLLSFSRSPRIVRAPADLSAVVARAAEAVSDLVVDRDVKLTVNAPPTLPVRCDAHKIQGVMVNLIKNAVEAGRAVTVTVGAHDGEAAIEVSDDGPGLSKEARAHLFEPFFTTKPNGTGLGLPTSRRFVEAHGGAIEVGPAGQGGAVFRVRLPIDGEAERAAPAAAGEVRT